MFYGERLIQNNNLNFVEIENVGLHLHVSDLERLRIIYLFFYISTFHSNLKRKLGLGIQIFPMEVPFSDQLCLALSVTLTFHGTQTPEFLRKLYSTSISRLCYNDLLQ